MSFCGTNSIECPHILDSYFVVGRGADRSVFLAGLGSDELRLPTPVRPGDALDLEVTVLEKRDSSRTPIGALSATKCTSAIKHAN